MTYYALFNLSLLAGLIGIVAGLALVRLDPVGAWVRFLTRNDPPRPWSQVPNLRGPVK